MREQYDRLIEGSRLIHSKLSYECDSPVEPKRFLTALYRDTAFYRDTALLRDTVLFRPPCIGIPHWSDRLIGVYRSVQTALYRDTALLRPLYWGIPTLSPTQTKTDLEKKWKSSTHPMNDPVPLVTGVQKN